MKIFSQDQEQDRERIAAIIRAAEASGDLSGARAAIESGEPASAYRARVLRDQQNHRPAMLGLSRRELRDYSLGAALVELSSPKNGRRSGLAFEIDEELRRIHGEPDSSNALCLPADVFAQHVRRDLQVASGSGGGYLVDTQVGGFIEMARPRSALGALGATIVEGLTANITFPRQVTGTTVKILTSEVDTATESQLTVGQLAMTPKEMSVYTEASRQLLLQANPAADRIIANDLLQAIATQVDFLGIRGTGGAGMPLGVLNTPGIHSVSGTSLALAGVLEFQTDIGDRLAGSCGYLTTLPIAALLAARPNVSNSAIMLWTGNLHTGALGGYSALSSSNMLTDAMAFGDWTQMVIASWGTLTVEINPYANFQAGIVGMRILHAVDIGLRDPGAFAAAVSIT